MFLQIIREEREGEREREREAGREIGRRKDNRERKRKGEEKWQYLQQVHYIKNRTRALRATGMYMYTNLYN